MLAPSPVLSVRNVRVEFSGRRGVAVPVDGVSFDIAAGEVLGVVGESGAGKSMTGAAVMGLLEPPGKIAAGEVLFKGSRIDTLPGPELRRIRGRHIGMVFQDPLTSLDPLYRIGEQLCETIRLHRNVGADEARQIAIGMLNEVGIPAAERRIDAYPHELSGGMRQRVVLALALCGKPELIIADEPTTALDVSIQAQIIALMKRLCRERGAAVLLVTHDMGVIAETADRVAVMYAGRIVEIGPVAQVIHAPLHPYTKGLMASIPSLTTRVERLGQIEGSMPRLTERGSGCGFAPRCPNVMERCRRQRPELTRHGSTEVACWLHEPAAPGAPAAAEVS